MLRLNDSETSDNVANGEKSVTGQRAMDDGVRLGGGWLITAEAGEWGEAAGLVTKIAY